jgi:hypothetical protein
VRRVGLLDRVRGWGSRFGGSPKRRFARHAMAIARRTPGVLRATYDPDRFAISLHRAEGGKPSWLYLANVFRETDGQPWDRRRERLAQLVRVMTAVPSDDGWDTVRPRLRPVLRPQTFGQGGPPGMQPPISRPALPFLHELVVVDQPEAMAYVTPTRLPDWGVSADEIFAAARANLAGIAARSLERPWPGDQTMITMIDDGDGYFTSLPLAPGWLAEVGERMGGPVLAFAPDNHTLLLCPLPDDVDPVYEMIEKHYEDAIRNLSPVGYRAGTDGRVHPYEPPPGHPHETAARRAEAVLAANEYGAQTEWLAKEYAQAGIDVHVGRLLAMVPPGGPAETIATWVDGMESLLPAARIVTFVRDGEVAMRVPWRTVAEHVPLTPEPLLAPPRYRVGGWPAEPVMEALREHRID